MKKKMIILLAAAMMALSAGSAFAAFGDMSLERYVYGATTEVATDLGNVSTLLATTDNKIGAGSSSFVNMGLSSGPLYATYFAYDNNTGNMWISAAKGLGTIVVADENGNPVKGSEAGYNSATSVANALNGYYNSKSQVTSGGATSASSARTGDGLQTWFKLMDQVQAGRGQYAGMIDVNQISGTEVALDLTTAAVQGLYFFDAATYGATPGVGVNFTEVGSVTTNIDGTTTVNASQVPIPAAAYLLGSGLLGMVGFRRKSKG